MIDIEGYKITKPLVDNHIFELYEGIELASSTKVILKKYSQQFLSQSENCSRLLIKELETIKLCSNNQEKGQIHIRESGDTEILIYNIQSQRILRDFLNTQECTFDFIYSVAIEIAKQLENIHSNNIAHYNISPDNILIENNTHKSLLINYCFCDNYESICDLHYISPEQTGRVFNKPDYRSDFYSLGVILYEMTTGKHPIQEIEPKLIYRKQITDRFPAPDSQNIRIPTALSKIIYKLTSKQAADRYQNATSLKHDLIKGQKLLSIKTHESFDLGNLDYISNIRFPNADSFFEKEKDEIIASVKHSTKDRITIINISGTLSQGKDDFTREVLRSLDKWKIFNVIATSLPSTSTIPFYSVSNILKETAYNLYNKELYSIEEIKNFIQSLPQQQAAVLIKMCPSIIELFDLNISTSNESISDTYVLNSAIRHFINFICKRTYPFVIYIENIELMDNSSMKLFIELVGDKELTNLVIIHSTLNNVSFSKSINNKNIILKSFEIPLLTRRKVTWLVQKTFKEIQESTLEQLVDLLIEKTNGKIKQIYHLIELFLKIKHIEFNNETFRWDFKLDKIKEYDIKLSYESIIEGHIKQLQTETLNLLIECSLIGYIFDLRILQLTHGYNIRSLSVLFRDIYFFDFIEPIERFSDLNKNNNPLLYKFRNTKIHKLFLDRITDSHLQYSSTIFSSIIDICKHNESIYFFFEEFIKKNQTLLSELSKEEKLSMLKFYYQKADSLYYLKRYKDAEIFLNYSISLLKEFEWTNDMIPLISKVYKLGMKTAIQTFYFARADILFETIKKKSIDISDKSVFYEIQIDSLYTRGKNAEANSLLHELLTIAKFYPKRPNSLIWKFTSYTTQLFFNNKLIKNTFKDSNKKKSNRRKVLGFINSRSFYLDKHIYNYSLYKIRKDCIISGIDKSYVFPLLIHSHNLIQDQSTFEKGINLSTILLQEILKHEILYTEELHYYIKNLLPFSNYGSHLNQIEIINNHFSNGEINKAIELAHINFSLDFFKGVNFKKLTQTIHNTVEKIGDASKKNELVSIIDIIEQRSKLLTQVRKKIDFEFDIDDKTNNSPGSLISRWNNVTLMLCFFLTGEYEKAQICAQNVLNTTNSEDTIPKCIAYFYDSLIDCETYEKKSISEQHLTLTKVKERLAYFKLLARYNSNNFMHNALILEAEYYNTIGNHQKAIQLYYESIYCSDKQNLHHMCGYAHRRLANIYEKIKLNEKAINHYIKSYNYYKFWGTETVANKIKFENFSIFDELEIRIYNIS